MKYSLEVSIELPRQQVIELFEDEKCLFKWQPELMSYEHLSGTKGQPGSRSMLRYKMGKREVEMIETITGRNPPEELSGTYETKGVWNEVVNQFAELGPASTKWTFHSHFKCYGLMWLVAFFMPGAFKKQSKKYMDNFKNFAEKNS